MAKHPQPRPGEPITLVFTKHGCPRYRVRLDVSRAGDGHRRQLRTTHDTLTAARSYVATQRTDRTRGVLVTPSSQTVGELLDSWMLGARHLRPSTRNGYETHLKPVRAVLGLVRIQNLTKRHIDDLVNHLLTTGGKRGVGRAASTVRQSLVILEQALDDAERQGLVARNVARLVAKPRQTRREMKTWTAAELAAFLTAAADDRYAALWRVSAFGLRRSEVVGLRWADIDFEAGLLRVSSTRVSVDGRVVATGEPKTASGRRTVPLDASTVDALRALRAQQARERLAAGETYGETGLVAVDEIGVPIHPDAWGRRFARIARTAGLPPIRLHDLRHTAASLMHESGTVSLRTLAAILGHADASFTLRTYAHGTDESIAAASATLASLLETRSAG